MPLKQNRAGQVLEAFRGLFERTNRLPAMLTTDAGSEFCANNFETFLNAHNVLHHIAKPPLKAQVRSWQKS